MKIVDAHLQRIFSRCLEVIADEVLNTISIARVYPEMGALNPAKMLEAHVQHLLFSGLRLAGYYTQAESRYFAEPKRRKIDLAIWLPDLKQWFFMEIECCPTQTGYKGVLVDAEKLAQDELIDPRDKLRGLLVYGFKEKLDRDSEHFRQKFENLSKDLESCGFRRIKTQKRDLEDEAFPYVIMGLWLANKSA